MNTRIFLFAFLLSLPLLLSAQVKKNIWNNQGRNNHALRVSANGRFLEYSDGTPFFWMGDTAWELFHRLNREDADLYLKDRADKGFTVIQAVALSEIEGETRPNAYGDFPLLDKDP